MFTTGLKAHDLKYLMKARVSFMAILVDHDVYIATINIAWQFLECKQKSGPFLLRRDFLIIYDRVGR